MKDITVIVPLTKEYDAKLFDRARKSIKNVGAVIYVGPEESLPKTLKASEKTIVNNGKTDFCSQVNLAVESVTTTYFSILEYDDEYTSFWFKTVEDYVKRDSNEASVYLPLTEVYDYNNPSEGAVAYSNEAVWASSFSDEIGCIDSNCLEDYASFNMTGSVFKTSDFTNIGGLKPSIKVAFWYEFLLRVCHNGKRLYVIPKVGYHHYAGRPGSLNESYKTELNDEQIEYWMDVAKKEYFFTKERNISEIYG